MKCLSIFFIGIIVVSCKKDKELKPSIDQDQYSISLTIEEANRLASLPFSCLQVEYPNKLNQTLGGDSDLQSPKELHPAFYGCFDWHSSVHGHWSLVTLLKEFPELENASEIRKKLKTNLSRENILIEIDYFKGEFNKSFERTYGWAWLLKLAEELHTWDDPLAKEMEGNLKPLTDLVVAKYLEFLPKLHYPIRVGEHSNTAFGLTFAFDFAKTVGNQGLEELIVKRAKDFFYSDKNCPIDWEPSGFDFLSPCLEEADIMRRVLSEIDFKQWVHQFLPQLLDPQFKLPIGIVADRTDGKLIHLDGVNFSRAWCLYGIANQFAEYNHLKKVAYEHIQYSLPSVVDGNYEGTHWLGSFAIYALQTAQND